MEHQITKRDWASRVPICIPQFSNGPCRCYLCCFFLFIEVFFLEGFLLVCRFSSGALFDCSVRGSSGKLQCRNFLLLGLQNSFSIFLPLIHLSIIFMCVLLFNPLIFASCYTTASKM